MDQDHFQTSPDPKRGYKNPTMTRKGLRISTGGSLDSDITVSRDSVCSQLG